MSKMAQKTAPRSPVKSTATTSTNLQIKILAPPPASLHQVRWGIFFLYQLHKHSWTSQRARSSGETHIFEKNPIKACKVRKNSLSLP